MIEQLWNAYKERVKACGGTWPPPPLPGEPLTYPDTIEPGEDVQSGRFVNRMIAFFDQDPANDRNRLWKWIDDTQANVGGDFNAYGGTAASYLPTYNTGGWIWIAGLGYIGTGPADLVRFRANAGLDAAGFRQSNVWPDDPAFTGYRYGKMLPGDLFGPWIFEDLAKAFTALKWTWEEFSTQTNRTGGRRTPFWADAGELLASPIFNDPTGWSGSSLQRYVLPAVGTKYSGQYLSGGDLRVAPPSPDGLARAVDVYMHWRPALFASFTLAPNNLGDWPGIPVTPGQYWRVHQIAETASADLFWNAGLGPAFTPAVPAPGTVVGWESLKVGVFPFGNREYGSVSVVKWNFTNAGAPS